MPEDLSSTCSKTVPLGGDLCKFCICIEIIPISSGEPFRPIQKSHKVLSMLWKRAMNGIVVMYTE